MKLAVLLAVATCRDSTRGSFPPSPSAVNTVGAHGIQIHRVAAELEGLASRSAPRLVAWQLAGLLRGLTSVRWMIRPVVLTSLAARVVADDCQRMKLASDKEVKEIVAAFAAQARGGTLIFHAPYYHSKL